MAENFHSSLAAHMAAFHRREASLRLSLYCGGRHAATVRPVSLPATDVPIRRTLAGTRGTMDGQATPRATSHP